MIKRLMVCILIISALFCSCTLSPEDNEAAVTALFNRGEPDYAHYLIVEKKADFTESYSIILFDDPNIPKDKKFYPVGLLRDWVYELDSYEYKLKMEINS